MAIRISTAPEILDGINQYHPLTYLLPSHPLPPTLTLFTFLLSLLSLSLFLLITLSLSLFSFSFFLSLLHSPHIERGIPI